MQNRRNIFSRQMLQLCKRVSQHFEKVMQQKIREKLICTIVHGGHHLTDSASQAVIPARRSPVGGREGDPEPVPTGRSSSRFGDL